MLPIGSTYHQSDLSVKHMHVDFNEKNPEQNIHYTTYLRRVNAMNISFAQLGQEEVWAMPDFQAPTTQSRRRCMYVLNLVQHAALKHLIYR